MCQKIYLPVSFCYLRTLTTCTASIRPLHAAAAAINRYLLPGRPVAANPQQLGQTDGRKPCSAHTAGSATNLSERGKHERVITARDGSSLADANKPGDRRAACQQQAAPQRAARAPPAAARRPGAASPLCGRTSKSHGESVGAGGGGGGGERSRRAGVSPT